ncbi:hypothetical protein H5410_052970 [Solanum commersonii]|uniref:Uncharacterized protein n=1 Tax=Solanum commersonii TaxID=4109 RepID=A0A9J5X3N4_SOLCO|nr:hypothetical protein H5410_052970 [Solanum commersonii]
MAHFQGQMIPGVGKPPILPIFVCNTPSFLMIRNSNLWSQFALTAKMTHFQGQTIPGAGKPGILSIFVCYSSPYFLVIRNFKVIFVEIFMDVR